MAHFAAYPDEDPNRFEVRRPTARASATGWLLRIVTVCVAIGALMVLIDLALRWTVALGSLDGRTADPTPIVVFVGDQRLTIPGNMIRFESQRSVGPHAAVELAVAWPSLAGYTPERRDDFLDGTADAPVVFLTIRRRDTATDSAGRVANVYQHFFEVEPLPAPPGLIGRRLSAESGLGGEEVYLEPGSTAPFATHCLSPDPSGAPSPCLTEIHAGGNLSVQIRFRKGLLADWAGIRSGVKALLASYGVTS